MRHKIFRGTRFKPILRESVGRLNREIRVALTNVPIDRTWLFLVGCYNSGTTLLAELLGQHPDISALPTEGHFITDQFVKDYEIGVPRMWVDREDVFRLLEGDLGPDVHRIKKEWVMRLDRSKSVFLEKSPPNTARTRWLQENFENTKFVAIVRNGYAVAEGIRRKAEPKHISQGWSIKKCAYQWARSNEILIEDSKHLRNISWVRYEDLAANPAIVLNNIAKFLEISGFGDISSDREWSIHERQEKIRNLNQESIERLSSEDICDINSVAKPMLEHFGYDPIVK